VCDFFLLLSGAGDVVIVCAGKVEGCYINSGWSWGERTERGSGSVAVKREKGRERLRFRGPTSQHARPPVGW
jgi:hypothetical protein